MTLLERINAFPPCLCRLSALDGRSLMSTRELARRSGLPKSTVHEISMLTTWAGVPVGVAEKFSSACGVNLLAPSDRRWKMRVRSWKRLSNSVNPMQRLMIDRLLSSVSKLVSGS